MEIKYSPTTIEDIKTIGDSFTIASGALGAQALYVQALALGTSRDYDQVLQKFTDALSHNNEVVTGVLIQMGERHYGNQIAKTDAARTIKKHNHGNATAALISNLPNKQSLELLYQENKGHYSRETINNTLIHVWKNPDETGKHADLKAIAAELKTYTATDWWNNMSEEDKNQLKNRGRDLLSQNS